MPRRIFITVAEVSGDQHAAQLIAALRQLEPDLVIEGHGGPLMRAAGATVHLETTTRAAMGLHALGRVKEMARILRWTRSYFNRNRPDVLICIDSPAMNFHFARLAHERGVKVLYYIAPQLWAWREGRMKKLRRWVDQVACILPFEEEYFRGHGVKATFVGHPLFDHLRPAMEGERVFDFSQRPPVVGLLPGSRRSEARTNLPPLLRVAQRIAEKFPGVRFLVPTTGGTHGVVEQLCAHAPVGSASADRLLAAAPLALEYAQDQFDVMVPRCDLCLTVSGTATLHVAGHGVPMVVVYRMNRALVKTMGWVMKTMTFALVNLLAMRAGDAPAADNPAHHIVPEFIPWFGEDRPVAQCALDLLEHPEKLAAQRERLRGLVATLDKPGASMNVARLAMRMMGWAVPPAHKRSGSSNDAGAPETGLTT